MYKHYTQVDPRERVISLSDTKNNVPGCEEKKIPTFKLLYQAATEK